MYLGGVLRISFFEANKILNPTLQIHRDEVKIEVQRRKSVF